MKRFMKRMVELLFVLAVIDAALIIGNLMGNQFPWLKAAAIGAAMVIFAIGFIIGGVCEKSPKRSGRKPSASPKPVTEK